MKNNRIPLVALEMKIQQHVKNVVLAPGTSVYLAEDEDGNPLLEYRLDIHRYRENARTLNEAGRAELATEDAAEAELVNFAEEIGTVTRDGDGSGDYGPITSYAIKL